MRNAMILSLGFLGACSSEGTTGSQPDGSVGSVVTVTGQANEFVLVASTLDSGTPVPVPIPGVEICVLDRPDIPCTTTNAAGAYSLAGVPASTDTGMVVSHDTHFDLLSLLTTTAANVEVNVNLPSDGLASAFASMVGVTYPNADVGVVSFFAFTPTGQTNDVGEAITELGGVKVTLTPSSARGPIYTTSGRFPDLSLTETQPGSSLGFIADVEPGTYELTFTHATKTACTPQIGFGWPLSSSRGMKVVVLAGKLTATSIICE